MPTPDLTSPSVQWMLAILSWCVIIFGALWLVAAVVGFFHRRAYNLTHAEAGHSKNIKPDFLKVDHAKREAAIQRGEAYDEVLTAREAAALSGGAATTAKVGLWSRLAALTMATLALVAAIIGSLQKIESVQQGINQMSSWDRFAQLVSDNKAGAAVAVIVIGANVVVFVNALKKNSSEHQD